MAATRADEKEQYWAEKRAAWKVAQWADCLDASQADYWVE